MTRRLGKGLDELLKVTTTDVPVSDPPSVKGMEIINVPIERIKPDPNQPRLQFDEESLKELADSIERHGVLQPILVRPLDDGRYQLIAGERRWRAAGLGKVAEVPVVVRNLDDEEVLLVALVENLHRENLNIIDVAEAYHRLNKEFQLTHAEIGQMLGKARSSITNLLQLRELPKRIQSLLRSRDLELGHAKLLYGLPSGEQINVARRICKAKWSVRQTERYVAKLKYEPTLPSLEVKDPDVERLESELSQKIGAPTTIRTQGTQKDRGEVAIRFSSLDELDGILLHLRR